MFKGDPFHLKSDRLGDAERDYYYHVDDACGLRTTLCLRDTWRQAVQGVCSAVVLLGLVWGPN